MSDNRSIQRAGQGQRAGAIMTPTGPAIIQVIDIPAGGGLGSHMGGGFGATPARKVGGINILGAILRRWWLVLIVTVLIGGAGIYAANNFVKPVYIGNSRISFIDRTGGDGTGILRLVSQAADVLTDRDIPLLVARQTAEDLAAGKVTDETRAFGYLVKGRDV